MKTFLLILIGFILSSCNSNKSIKNASSNKAKVDTLFYYDKIYLDSNGSAQPYKKFKYNTKTKKGLPKNEEILMTLSYSGDYEKLVKHTNVELIPVTKKLKIKKLNDNQFSLFIDSSYNDSIITMKYYLSPRKNYVIKFNSQDDVIKHPEKTERAIFVQLVEQE